MGHYEVDSAANEQSSEYPGDAVEYQPTKLPYPEPGIRLVKQDEIDRIDSQMKMFQGELTQAVAELDEHYWELQSAARQRLGRLYDASDYPASLTGLFAISWDWPSVEPPPYLRQLSPDLYREECQRVQARFDEAVRLAEAAFVEELAKLVSHLTERLSGSEDCPPGGLGHLGPVLAAFSTCPCKPRLENQCR